MSYVTTSFYQSQYDYDDFCYCCGRRPCRCNNNDYHRSTIPVSVDIDAQLNSAEKRVLELQAKKEAMARFGSESDYGDDDAILFKKKFPGNRKTYTYVAVRTPVGWFITGQNAASRLTFNQLVETYLLDAAEVWVCKEWAEIP